MSAVIAEHSSPNAHAEWIARIEDEVRVSVNERGALDAGVYLPIAHLNTAFKHAAHNAFLFPHLAFEQLAVGIQAGQLGAGSGAAWRSVISLAWAQDEIPAVDSGVLRGTEKFDVVYLFPVRACDPLSAQRLADCPGKVRQRLDVVERKFVALGLGQKEPVSAPGHVAAYRSKAGDIDCDLRRAAIAGDIIHCHFSAVVKDGAYRTHRRFDAMLARLDAVQIGKRRDHPDGAVSAHAQISHIVEEDRTGGAGRVHRFTQ